MNQVVITPMRRREYDGVKCLTIGWRKHIGPINGISLIGIIVIDRADQLPVAIEIDLGMFTIAVAVVVDAVNPCQLGSNAVHGCIELNLNFLRGAICCIMADLGIGTRVRTAILAWRQALHPETIMIGAGDNGD